MDRNYQGENIGLIAGIRNLNLIVSDKLDELLFNADVMVDFTCHEGARENIHMALNQGIPAVVGTTGFSEEELSMFNDKAIKNNVPLFIAPNFAIGAVLMMKFARMASLYFSSAEIIELHHNKKKDAPSGTSIATAKNMIKPTSQVQDEKELLEGARGGDLNGIKIHSIRLPGLVAHQQVILGSKGELLTIRHDSMGRESFMPGLIMAVKKVKSLSPGLTFGLDKLLDF